MLMVLMLCSVVYIETGEEIVRQREEARAYWARLDEERIAKLPCPDQLELGFERACQGEVMKDPKPHVTADYVHSYCSGGADAYVLTSRIDWPVLPGTEAPECPAKTAKEFGAQLGIQLRARLISRW